MIFDTWTWCLSLAVRTLQDLEVALVHEGEDDEPHLLLHVVVPLLHGDGERDVTEGAADLLQVSVQFSLFTVLRIDIK